MDLKIVLFLVFYLRNFILFFFALLGTFSDCYFPFCINFHDLTCKRKRKDLAKRLRSVRFEFQQIRKVSFKFLYIKVKL